MCVYLWPRRGAAHVCACASEEKAPLTGHSFVSIRADTTFVVCQFAAAKFSNVFGVADEITGE